MFIALVLSLILWLPVPWLVILTATPALALLRLDAKAIVLSDA